MGINNKSKVEGGGVPWRYARTQSSLLYTEVETETLKSCGSFYISFSGLVVFSQNCSYRVVLSTYVLSAQIQFFLLALSMRSLNNW